ncbi:hypothetical protein BD309DRAFT_1025514 [Dichomitus squalens]|nr:hypothetical protein BD309DRAFT_1025514 [Dichomitus squalens]
MSSSPTVADLCTQLRLLLESSPDAISINEILARVDSFVLECSASQEASTLLYQLEVELEAVYDEVLCHALFPRVELFLAFLYHLRPVLPSIAIISTWFDLVLRPTLREPKLPLPAVNYAKELIITALDPGNNFSYSDAEDADSEADKQKERVGDFRRRLVDLYLLDAYNESSGDDVLEWAELDQDQRERKACWKSNLEDILVRIGLERPKDFFTELYHCFILPISRLQLLTLLNAYTSHPHFPAHADVLASHPLMTSLLHSLIFDNSSTVCTIALTILSKLLPVFAVKASGHLKSLLPLLLVVLARILCWKERPPWTPLLPASPETDDTDAEDAAASGDDGLNPREGARPLPIREDLDWTRLELTFDGAPSGAPSVHRYFTFLYYLFPYNTIRFLRFPVKYLNDSGLESVYALDWDAALDEEKIRSKSERLLRGHVLHPLLIWREPQEELEKPDFWSNYDIPQIVGGATMLDVRNAALGLRQQEQQGPLPVGAAQPSEQPPSPQYERASRPPSIAEPMSLVAEAEGGVDTAAPLSSSVETVHLGPELHSPDTPAAAAPVRLKVSLSEMVATSVALRSGFDVEIVDAPSEWSTTLFPLQPRTRSPSRNDGESPQPREEGGEPSPGPRPSDKATQGDGTVPAHVAQAISALQREILLLRNDLNLELWTARENVAHIGRLYKDRVLSRNEEAERQGLHNKLKEYKHMVTRLRRELKEEKDQAVTQRLRYTDWNRELQDRIAALRAEKKKWTSEAASMRAAEKEAKDTFAAQGKLLADANQLVFRLETQIKENAHKVDRLHDYETQIDQLIKLQRLWESDVQKLNDSKEYLIAFASKYRKMELRLEAYEKTLGQMDASAAVQRQQILVLESEVKHCKKQLETARRSSVHNAHAALPTELVKARETHERLRRENDELREEVEELNAMVEELKGKVSGRTGLIGSPRVGSPISPRSSPPRP